MAIPVYRGSNSDIETIASSVRDAVKEKTGLSLCGRRLLEKLVELTGGTITMTEDPSQQEVDGGSLIIQGKSDYAIYLSPYTTLLRDNFTVAHELGHFFLHFILQDPQPAVPLKFTRYGTDPAEWQANRFAASLLMPEILFREKYVEFQGDSVFLAGFFEVSRSAVETRGESLGCPVK